MFSAYDNINFIVTGGKVTGQIWFGVIGSYKKIRPKASSFAISNAERKRIINKHRRTAQEIQKARDRNRNLTFENVGQYQYQQRPFNFSNLSNLSNLPHFETVSRFLGGVGN